MKRCSAPHHNSFSMTNLLNSVFFLRFWFLHFAVFFEYFFFGSIEPTYASVDMHTHKQNTFIAFRMNKHTREEKNEPVTIKLTVSKVCSVHSTHNTLKLLNFFYYSIFLSQNRERNEKKMFYRIHFVCELWMCCVFFHNTYRLWLNILYIFNWNFFAIFEFWGS